MEKTGMEFIKENRINITIGLNTDPKYGYVGFFCVSSMVTILTDSPILDDGESGGQGKTPNEAFKDFIKRISNKKIAIDYFNEGKRIILQVPNLVVEF